MSGKTKKRRLLVGLTGGIGSGKTVVADLLRKKGIPVVDADQLAREVVAPGSPGLAEIAREFGKEILLTDGTLDRAQLRRRIFADPETRQRLEAITHPRIRKLGRERSDKFFRDGHEIVVYEAPLLIEAGNYKHLDAIIGVSAKDELRARRIVERDGTDLEEAKGAIAAQMPQDRKMQFCDYVIQNDSTEADLASWVEAILLQLNSDTKAAKRKAPG